MLDYHYQAVSDACIIAHAYDTTETVVGRAAGIFLDYMRGKYAETWVGSQTFF